VTVATVTFLKATMMLRSFPVQLVRDPPQIPVSNNSLLDDLLYPAPAPCTHTLSIAERLSQLCGVLSRRLRMIEPVSARK